MALPLGDLEKLLDLCLRKRVSRISVDGIVVDFAPSAHNQGDIQLAPGPARIDPDKIDLINGQAVDEDTLFHSAGE